MKILSSLLLAIVAMLIFGLSAQAHGPRQIVVQQQQQYCPQQFQRVQVQRYVQPVQVQRVQQYVPVQRIQVQRVQQYVPVQQFRGHSQGFRSGFSGGRQTIIQRNGLFGSRSIILNR